MDSPAAVRAFRTYGRNRICYGRARQSRLQRIDNRGPHLADEYRHDRKRSLDRNRRALRFPLRSRDYFLVGLCLAKKIPMAHLVANVDLPRAGLVGERPAPSRIFLWNRLRRPVANEELAFACPSRALHRARDYVRNFRSLGDSVSPEHHYASSAA